MKGFLYDRARFSSKINRLLRTAAPTGRKLIQLGQGDQREFSPIPVNSRVFRPAKLGPEVDLTISAANRLKSFANRQEIYPSFPLLHE